LEDLYITSQRPSNVWRHFTCSHSNENTTKAPTTYTRIQSKQKLDEALLARNVSHFQQAKDTPFTAKAITEYVGEDGCHCNVAQILNGNVKPNLTRLVTLLLQQFKSNTHPILLTFTFEDMCKGFKNRRESTTTSPSEKHLGLYRSLVHTMYMKSTNNTDLVIIQTASDCLTIQHLLITLAICHCHTYNRC
jgi:hypothetical protein